MLQDSNADTSCKSKVGGSNDNWSSFLSMQHFIKASYQFENI